ncbi:MAG TPA: DUF2382 domain-containing protein [Thermomicrobiales bacterium]|nr:DUF2382 domain-containing protein [Thermomicrobiales bacterium]
MSQYDVNRPKAGYTEIATGWDVVGADGDKIGSIAAVQPHYISVEKGFLFKEDLFIPTSTITSVQDDTVYLNVTKAQIEHEDWHSEPEMNEWHRETADYNDQLRATDVNSGVDRRPGDRMHIPLSEEHLEVGKHDVERGRAQVRKDVTEEEQSVDVPLREEEVRVERHAAGSGQVPDDAFQEQDIEIPIRGEEADVTKRARVREEVDIEKDVRERTEHASDTVRREEVHVDHDDNLREERENRP